MLSAPFQVLLTANRLGWHLQNEQNRSYISGLHNLASSAKWYHFAHFLNFAVGINLENCLLVQQPQTPLNNICDVGYTPCLGALAKIKSFRFSSFLSTPFAAVYCVAIFSKRIFRGPGNDPSTQFFQKDAEGELQKRANLYRFTLLAAFSTHQKRCTQRFALSFILTPLILNKSYYFFRWIYMRFHSSRRLCFYSLKFIFCSIIYRQQIPTKF